MQSKAATVEQYLAELPEDRRAAISTVRDVILRNLDKKYQEGMLYGMIGYSVPHSIYPDGYHCDPRQPLPFAGLASQKQYMSLYLGGMYSGCDGEADTQLLKWFRNAWAAAGKKLDMGKVCIRFKRVEDVPLEVIGEAIRRVPLKAYIEYYEKAILVMNKQAAARSAAKKAGKAAKKTAKKPAKKVAKKSGKKVAKKSAHRR